MIAVIDYGVGNLFSVEKALLYLGADVAVTKDAETIARADKLILPGVGAFGDCMRNLTATGLIPLLLDRIGRGCPLLGICVGLQILFDGSEESPGVRGLGVFPGMIRKIPAAGLKVPHMGWNSLDIKEPRQPLDLFAGLPANSYVYFVHSFHAVRQNPEIVTACTEYGAKLTAAVAQKNVQATQFHPEKSSAVGLQILHNFIQN